MGPCLEHFVGLGQEPSLRVRPFDQSVVTISLFSNWASFSFLLYNSVNLGGWLVIEPFITPSFFEKYSSAVDEWSLSLAIAADTKSGGLQSVLEKHYSTFIVSTLFIFITCISPYYVLCLLLPRHLGRLLTPCVCFELTSPT